MSAYRDNVAKTLKTYCNQISIHLPIYLLTCLPTFLSVWSVSMSLCQSVSQSVTLSVSLSVFLPVCSGSLRSSEVDGGEIDLGYKITARLQC